MNGNIKHAKQLIARITPTLFISHLDSLGDELGQSPVQFPAHFLLFCNKELVKG
jgi:hypothetical protein